MEQQENDKAPLFGSWNYWYLLVILFLVLLIFLFRVLANRYS